MLRMGIGTKTLKWMDMYQGKKKLTSSLDTLFNGMSQVWTAGTNIRPEYITSIALIVDTARELDIFIRDGIGITYRSFQEKREWYVCYKSGRD